MPVDRLPDGKVIDVNWTPGAHDPLILHDGVQRDSVFVLVEQNWTAGIAGRILRRITAPIEVAAGVAVGLIIHPPFRDLYEFFVAASSDPAFAPVMICKHRPTNLANCGMPISFTLFSVVQGISLPSLSRIPSHPWMA